MNWKKRPDTIQASNLEELKKVLTGDHQHYPDRDIKNLAKAGELISYYLVSNQIVIYGDYDADGVLSSAILLKGLSLLAEEAGRICKKEPSQINVVIPDRVRDGYGFTTKAAENYKGCLLILVDNGISAVEAIRKANSNDNVVVVVDHHLPGNKLPEAEVIVNPHADEEAVFNDYCAAGLAYRLLKFMLEMPWVNIEQERIASAVKEFKFLAALATVSDVVTMRDENWQIVRDGLNNIPQFWQDTVNMMVKTSSCNKEWDVTETDVSFNIAPVMNAPGRIGHLNGENVCRLAIDGANERMRVINQFMQMNMTRREETEKGTAIAEALANAYHDDKVLVIQSNDISLGIAGAIAGKLADKYARPVIVFGPDTNGYVKGSARGNNSINMKEALDEIKQDAPNLLVNYGGHANAAGMTLRTSDLDEFRRMMNAKCPEAQTTEEISYYDYEIDEKIDVAALYDMLRQKAPYGEGNPEPVFKMTFHPIPGGVQTMGKKKDSICLSNQVYLKAVGFGMAEKLVPGTACYDIYGTLMVNRYKEGRTYQIKILDIIPQNIAVAV